MKEAKHLLFIHSGCCGAHWEMVFNKKTKKYSLVCEKCGKPTGGIEVAGPDLSDHKCEHPECQCQEG